MSSSDEEFTESDCDMFDGLVFSCPFCPFVLDNSPAVFNHCQETHEIDIIYLVNDVYKMNQIEYIKFINYLRFKPKNKKIDLTRKLDEIPWNCEQYMTPTLSNDGLLLFDVENDQDELDNKEVYEPTVTIKTEEYYNLLEKANNLNPKIFQNGLENSKVDETYAASYSNYDIHREMLQDRERTLAYRRAISLNSDIFMHSSVLDLGCGTGILSLFSAQFGADFVVGVDMSNIAFTARSIVKENNMEDKITIIKSKIEDIKELPRGKVDIIVSEWMGYFLVYESMFNSVIYAKKNWLRDGGFIFPDRANLFITAMDNENDIYNQNIGFWSDVYGFRMTAMGKASIRDPHVLEISLTNIVTSSYLIKSWDLYVAEYNDHLFEESFELVALRSSKVSAFVAYFDVHFDKKLKNKIVLSTSPECPTTHWRQTVFFVEKPFDVEEGSVIRGKLLCSANPNSERSLSISICYGDCRVCHYTFL